MCTGWGLALGSCAKYVGSVESLSTVVSPESSVDSALSLHELWQRAEPASCLAPALFSLNNTTNMLLSYHGHSEPLFVFVAMCSPFS